MKIETQAVTQKLTTYKATITKDDLLKLVAEKLGLNYPPPNGILAYVQVPGGGDWSNMKLELDEFPIQIEWATVVEVK